MTGVPVMSPSPPASTVENVQAGPSWPTLAGPIFLSFGWVRVLAKSCP
jgi:hypothetical protein